MTRRKPRRERRQEIAESTLRIIGERGRTAFSTISLADAVGVTTGALFRHFSSLDEILEEAVRVAVDKVEATFPPPSLAPLERLLELARRRVALVGSEAGLAWLLRSNQAELSLPSGATERLRRLVDRSRAFLLAALREGGEDGSIRSDIGADVLLVPVVGTIHTLMGMPGFQGLAAPRREQRVEAVLAGLARLLAPPPASPTETAKSSTEEGRQRP